MQLCFRNSTMDSDLVGLKDTSHLETWECTFVRSAFNEFAVN